MLSTSTDSSSTSFSERYIVSVFTTQRTSSLLFAHASHCGMSDCSRCIAFITSTTSASFIDRSAADACFFTIVSTTRFIECSIAEKNVWPPATTDFSFSVTRLSCISSKHAPHTLMLSANASSDCLENATRSSLGSSGCFFMSCMCSDSRLSTPASTPSLALWVFRIVQYTFLSKHVISSL